MLTIEDRARILREALEDKTDPSMEIYAFFSAYPDERLEIVEVRGMCVVAQDFMPRANGLRMAHTLSIDDIEYAEAATETDERILFDERPVRRNSYADS